MEIGQFPWSAENNDSPVYIAGDGLDQRSDAGLLAVLGGHQLRPQTALQPPVVLHLKIPLITLYNSSKKHLYVIFPEYYQQLILEYDIQSTLELLV